MCNSFWLQYLATRRPKSLTSRFFHSLSQSLNKSDPAAVSSASRRQDSLSPSKVEKTSNRKLSDLAGSTYCINLVKKNDYEGYLTTLLHPKQELRPGLFAIKAFNTEIALVRDQVTDKDRGIFRLAFWKDSLNTIYDKPECSIQHPVLQEISRISRKHGLSKLWLTNLIESRERSMGDSPFNALSDLEAYCNQTVTSTLYLGLQLTGVKCVDTDHAASHLGKAIGLATFIRSIPFNAQRRRVLIPTQLLVHHKLSQESFIRLKNPEKIQEVVFEIASQAHSHYEKAKALVKSCKEPALPLFLSGAPSEIYLRRLQKKNFNPFDPSLSSRYGLLPFRLYWRKITKSYL